MASFKLGNIMSEQTLSQARDTHKVIYVKRSNIFPNPFNEEVYSTEGIELLSYSIEDKGLLEPIIIRPLNKSNIPENATYEIVSGHRRMLAIENLIKRNPDKTSEYEYIPSIVRKDSGNNAVKAANEDLIEGNIYNRNKSDAERAKELAIKKEMLEERKRRGENIPGKLIELIAKEMDISLHQAKKFNAINNNASENVKEAFDKGEISTQTAYELSKADKNTQDKIIDTESELTAKSVKVAIEKSKPKKSPSYSDLSDTYQKNIDDLPYGKNDTNDYSLNQNSDTDKEEKSVSEPSQKLTTISKLAALMKKFAESKERISFDESEIKEAVSTLNTVYMYVSNSK